MSTITGPRSTSLIEKDNYSKKCHWTIHHYNCGHRKHAPRIVHVGCPQNPQNKKRCDNMAPCAREVYFSEPCSKCRPKAEETKEMSSDPFDALLKRAKEEEDARKSIRKIEHLASAALQNHDDQKDKMENLALQIAKTPKTKSSQQEALVQNKPPLAGDDACKLASHKNGKDSVRNEEQTANKNEDDMVESANPHPEKLSGHESRSLLASVWNLMKPTRINQVDSTQYHDDDWSDSDEEANWESMKDEDNQLWKEKEDDWVHVK